MIKQKTLHQEKKWKNFSKWQIHETGFKFSHHVIQFSNIHKDIGFQRHFLVIHTFLQNIQYQFILKHNRMQFSNGSGIIRKL